MKGTTISARNKFNFLSLFKENKAVLILLVFLIGGILIGSLLIRQKDGFAFLNAKSFFNNYFSSRTEATFFEIYIQSIVGILPFLLLIFIFGASFIGYILVPIIISFKGVLIGMLSGYMYSVYAFKGIAFCILMLLPICIITVFVLIISGREALNFSSVVSRSITKYNNNENVPANFKVYCFRNITLLFVLLVSSLIETLFCLCFLGFFDF